MAKVFISYARSDGRELALRLQESLSEVHIVWLDTREIVGGISWSEAIEKAIDGSNAVLALLSPCAMASAICRGEQLRALRRRVPVLPVQVTANVDRPVYLEAANYRDFSDLAKYADTLRLLLTDLDDLTLPGLFGTAADAALTMPECALPPPVLMAVPRPDAVKRVQALVSREGGPSAGAATVIFGLGGSGKTSLAVELCRDVATQDFFPDGIVWLDLGSEGPDPLAAIATLARAFGHDVCRFDNMDRASRNLRSLLLEKAALVVLDGLTDHAQVRPFLVDAPRSHLLITTRLTSLAAMIGAQEYPIEPMQGDAAVRVLQNWSGRLDDAFPGVAERLRGLPLALRIAGTQMRKAESAKAWLNNLTDILQLVTSERLRGARDQDLVACFEMSLRDCEPIGKELFYALGTYRRSAVLPRAGIARFWQRLQPSRPLKMLQAFLSELVELSLVEQVGSVSVRLHDLLSEYAFARLGDAVRDTHRALLASYKELQEFWSRVQSDGYIRDNLLFHVFEAHREQGIRDFLREEDRESARAWATVRSPTEYAVDLETCHRYLRAGASVGIADDFRISLSRSSLRSFSANLPAPLFVALVERGVWSVSRAAEEVSRLDDTALRVEVMLALSSLPGAQPIEIMNECIATLPLVSSDRRQKFVESVATHLCTMHQGARAAQLIEEHCGVRGLEKRRAPFLFESADAETLMAIEAAIVAHYSEGDVNRAYLLSELGDVAHDVAPEIFARAVREAKRVESTFDRAFVCAPLVGHMTSDEQQPMLPSLVDFLMRGAYVEVFAQVAHLIDADTLARVVAASIDKAERCEDSCRVLELAAPYLKDKSRDGLVDALLRHGGHASDLGRIAAACARADSARRASHVAEGFAAIASLPDGWNKARCFEDLSNVLEASEFDEARSLLARWSDQDSAPYRDEARRALDKVQTERERPGVTTEEDAAGKLNECTDAAAVNRDLERILIGSDLEERRRALASLAPSLSTEQLKRVMANERGIHDVAAIGAALETLEKSLQSSEECHADVTPIRGESFTRGMLPLLEREIGVLSPDWLGRAVARAYAKTGAVRHAFALARKEIVDLALRKLAFGDVAALASPEQIEAEWGNRPADFEAADEAPLLARMSADRVRAIRDEQLGSAERARRSQYWRQLRRAEFAVFLEDGRAVAIANYLDAVERDVGRRHEVGLLEHHCALLEGLSRVMTDSTYDRTIALIRDTRSRLNDNYCRMFLVLAARRGGTLLDEAVHDVGYLDKPERVPVLADAAESCSGDTRARIVNEAVAYARSQDYQPIVDMCIASYVCEPSVRVELLQEALVRCGSERNFSHQDARAVAATACCLLPYTDRVQMLQGGLAAAEQLYRPRFLSWLSALQLLLAQTCSPEELRDFKFALSGAAARWP